MASLREWFGLGGVEEAKPAQLAQAGPANVKRAGYEFGIPPSGLNEFTSNVGETTQTDRRAFLNQLYESFLACPWAWSCVQAISKTITGGPLVFDWDSDDGEGDQEKPDKPDNVEACERLLRYTNPREDIRQLMRSTIADLLVFGDAFIEVCWVAGVPVALFSLDSPSMYPQADEHGNITGYVQLTDFQQRATFEPHEVIHISLDSPRSGMFGVSPTQAALLPITSWLFAAATLKETHRKGGPVNLHVDMPQGMAQPEVNRWVHQYMTQNVGPRNLGRPVVTKGGAAVHELGFRKVEELLHTLDQKRDEILSTFGVPPAMVGVIESGNIGAGSGEAQRKALDLSTMIPTPTGWTTMGELKVGDQVLDETGRPCNVIGTYEVPNADSWRLEFSDGSHIDCCADHLWVTWTYEDRKAYGRWSKRPAGQGVPDNWPTWRNQRGSGPRVRRTEEIVKSLHAYRGRGNHSIPLAGALQLPHRDDLPVDPYVLGVWLGDGTACRGTFAAADPEVVEEVRAAGYTVTERMSSRDSGRVPYFCVHGLDGTLREIGLKNNKHVPPAYLRASAAQRLALLQGLMDTDGYHSGPDGYAQVAFTNTNERLVDAVVELARSLGQKPTKREYRAKLNGKDHGPRWDVKWTATIPVFRLSRKLAQCPPMSGFGALKVGHRRIVDAVKIPDRPMRCITVDSPNEMYLAGEGMIPTHNTFVVNVCQPLAALVLEKLDFHLVKNGFKIEGWHLKFQEVDMRDSQVIEQIRDTRLRNGAWTLDRYRAEIGEPPVEGGNTAVLVDRQNLVLWRDMDAFSKSLVAKNTRGTDVTMDDPGDTDTPVSLSKAAPKPAPPALGPAQQPPDDSEEPGDDTPAGESRRYPGRPGRVLRDDWRASYRRRLHEALAELPGGE